MYVGVCYTRGGEGGGVGAGGECSSGMDGYRKIMR